MDSTKEQFIDHALSYDPDFERLKVIVKGLNEAIAYLRDEELAIDWWGTIDKKYEHESIYNLAILAFEHYLKTVLTGVKIVNEEDISQLYYSEPAISLIFTLAKYIKNDLDFAHKTLNHHHLNIHDYPVYNGVIALNSQQNLEEIIKQLQKWRTKIINIYYQQPETE
ncbi:hypothetical protein [Chryseobacterium artocarpi]|uniref:hypothetical protein n=1 Tax=Chryseobacterium artocarpi TaxID=1414727 RepID=UPI003F33405C